MANKDLFKQAIAEAKSVREAAIANAKEALEETLTPHLKDMLAAKLQEMDDKSEEVEEVVNEVEEDVDEAKHHDKDDAMEEGSHEDDVDEAIEEDLTEVEPAGEAEEEAEDDSEESEDEAEAEVEEDEELGNLSVDEFKDLIRDIIAQEIGHGDHGDDLGADDMDAGEVEPAGDEAPIDAPEEGDEEIDLDELLAELEEANEEVEEVAEEVEQTEAQAETKTSNVNRIAKSGLNEDSTNKELDQALETIETLKAELHEVNTLNAKLLYVNKIFKAHNLNEGQKVNVIAAFDKAETVKEVKLVYETVIDTVTSKTAKTAIKEVKGSASKATGTTASNKEVISEVSSAVLRMQKLAGIIK